MTDRKTELVVNFAQAAGELVTEGLNGLNAEKRALVAQSLASGLAHIRLIVILSPLVIIGALHHTSDRTVKPHVLFRIDGDGLPEDGDFH
jgi:hypothetical protein